MGDVEASVPRPAKELKGYEKIFLKKGEQKRVEVTLTDEAFRFYGRTSTGLMVFSGKCSGSTLTLNGLQTMYCANAPQI